MNILTDTNVLLWFLSDNEKLSRDPFDRLIYAQTKTENMIFLFTDDVFNLYES